MRKFLASLLLFYVVAVSFVDIFCRYLTFYFDSFTLNFYRFFVGSLSLLIVSRFFFKSDLKKLINNFRQLGEIIILAGILTASQFFYIKGLSYTSAVMGPLINILGLLIGIVLVGLVFADERKIIKGRNFIMGLMFSIFGVIGLSISKGIDIPKYSSGIYYLIVAVALVGVVNLLTKRLIINSHPVCLSSLVTMFMSVFFFIGALFNGNLVKIVQVSSFTNFILLGSGVYGLMIGMGLGYVCIKMFGISKVNLISLSTPVFTGIFAYLLLRESLNVKQILFATILIGGCFIAIRNKSKVYKNNDSFSRASRFNSFN